MFWIVKNIYILNWYYNIIQTYTVKKKKWASLIAKLVKNLAAMQETQVRFLCQEDPLEKEMATNSGILAWRIL